MSLLRYFFFANLVSARLFAGCSVELSSQEECADEAALQKKIRAYHRMADRAEDEADRLSGKDAAEQRHARKKAQSLRIKACQMEEQLHSLENFRDE